MKFEYDFKDGNTRFFYRVQPDEILDEKIWNILKKGTVHQFLLPLDVKRNGNGIVLVYDIAGTINMLAWLDGASSDKQHEMQQKVKYSISVLIKSGIPREEIVSELQKIYVDMRTEEVKLICIPLKQEIKEFVRREDGPLVPPAPHGGFIDMDEDMEEEKLKKKNSLFKGMISWNEKKKEEEIIPEEQNDTWNSDVGYMPMKTSMYMPQDEEKMFDSNVEDEFSAKDRNGFDLGMMSEFSENTKAEVDSIQKVDFERDNFEAEPLQNDFNIDDEGNDGTVMLRDDGSESTVLLKARLKPDATLIRLQTQEKFRITTDICKIGKRALMVDICIRNNPTVSREHCAIYFEEEEGKYYLEDKESSNYTYLNGNRVMPGQKALLKDGDQIRISDEEFIFRKGEVR